MFGITVVLHHGSLDGSTCIVVEKKVKYTDEKRGWNEVSPEEEENNKTSLFSDIPLKSVKLC